MVIQRSNNYPTALRTRASGTMVSPTKVETIGWEPTCTCHGHFENIGPVDACTRTYVPDTDAPAVVPAVVLDPFLGSGRTLAVAVNLGRSGIGVELNPDYIELAHKQIADYGKTRKEKQVADLQPTLL
jgi:hypothetical protein